MDIRRWLGALALLLLGAGGIGAQETDPDAFQARIWLDRGDEPLLQRGDRVRIYYRASTDAYVAIFHIDTDGSVQLLHPRSPDDEHYVRGARDYRLLFPQSSYWYVDEYPGEGYFFLIASPEPFDFSAFGYSAYQPGWDLTSVGREVYTDPYAAIDEYVARLIPDWERVPYALDFISYDIGEPHDYPRFLCYDCHGFQSYPVWNPYTYACSSFRVVIWDDPYFYPAYRYRGTKVVFVRPQPGLVRYEFKERAAGEPWSPLTRTRQPPMRRSVEYTEPAAAAPRLPEYVPPRRRVVPSDQVRDDRGVGGRAGPDRAVGGSDAGRTALPRSGSGAAVPRRDPGASGADAARRPSTGLPGRTSVAPPPRPRQGERPVLQRRPPAVKAPPKRSGGGSGVVGPRPTGRSPAASRTDRSRGNGGGRVVFPSRPSGGASARPGSSRPTVRPAPSSPGSRPSVRSSRPPAKPPARRGGSGGAKKPPPRRTGGGG